MITRIEPIRQTPIWQQALAQAISDIDELLALVGLDRRQLNISDKACDQFSLKITRAYIDRISKANVHDPLLRQILPIDDEMQAVSGYSLDPVSDQQFIQTQGIIQKYHGRALIMTTGACAIHCRYCFRRHFPYSQSHAASNNWHDAVEYLQNNEDIGEVILSGGDPLTLTDGKLSQLIDQLAAIPHIHTLRLHTRLPIVLPQRVCADLLQWLSQTRLNTVCVIHCNHAREIDNDVAEALAALASAGVTLLNQSVLLNGVNDNADDLAELSQALFNHGVIPYYLHMLDPVSGSAHFNVTEDKAVKLIGLLQRRLPGYLVPRLVREIAGQPSKTTIELNS